MTKHIKAIANREEWNGFVYDNTSLTFHQSWEWGELFRRRGNKTWHLGYFEDQKLLAVCLTIKIEAKRGIFLHVPHGPIFKKDSGPEDVFVILEGLTKRLKGLGGEEGCSFVRIAPTLPRNNRYLQIFSALGLRRAPIFVQSELSWRINIQREDSQLLGEMRKTTRQIIKKADSFDVTYKKSNKLEDFDEFYELYSKTVVGKEFTGHSYGFIKEEVGAFSEVGGSSLYFVYEKNTLLAAAVIIHQGSSGFYHYAASQRSENNTPGPHLLQWYVIRDLRKHGYAHYDMWGIAPDNKPQHPWRGLTVFKKGFGGQASEYLQTHDIVLQWLYWPNWVIETARRIKRGY